MSPRPRAYLAGPEVFLRDPHAQAECKKAMCTRHGFVGVFPLDAELDLEGIAPADAARRIASANEALIRSCQLLVANLTPFRGPSADVGTAFEMGFARALGLPVFAYTNAEPGFEARTLETLGATAARRPDGSFEDAAGLAVEAFGCVDNLMLDAATSGAVVTGTAAATDRFTDLAAFEACLRIAARTLG